uniref:Putative secreted protein n=1 Tax=Anopheles darlingi TaxID=43151 RepID=A0A2M4DMV7_ANODA
MMGWGLLHPRALLLCLAHALHPIATVQAHVRCTASIGCQNKNGPLPEYPHQQQQQHFLLVRPSGGFDMASHGSTL